ncbi:hypothetical protein [Streptomyces anulatus]|uniref:hypothetical protein n=1 Tax=Streptomyces anulatus TaxID=1892 RepID=UPI0033DF092C
MNGRHEIFHGHEGPALVVAHPEAVPSAPTYFLAKDDGGRRIAAAQNTQVFDAETLTAG